MALGPTGTARANLADGLVGYWRLDEAAIAADTVAADASGQHHDGVYVGAPAPSPRVPPLRYGDPRSVAFARASHQAVQVATMPAALKPAAVTISAWYLATSTDTNRTELVSAGDSYILYLDPTGLGAGRRQAGGWSDVVGAVPALLDGQWHHVAATIDGAALAVFFDGQPVASMPKAGAIVYDLGPDLWLGRYGNGAMPRDFEGNLDEVAIYARVLGPGEIAELAQGAQPGGVVAQPDAGGGPPDAGAPTDAAAPVDVAVPVDVAMPIEVGGPTDVGPSTDAPAAVETTPAKTPDAAPTATPILTGDPPRHRFHDAPPACAMNGSPSPTGLGLLLTASLLMLTGRRRRARPSRR